MPREALPPLIVRADADATIGGGHLVRCIALAEAWHEAGGGVRFVGKYEGDFPSLLDRAGFLITPILRPHPDPLDADVTMHAIREAGGAALPFVALDGYHFTGDYQQQIRAGSSARVLLMDDGDGARACAADIVLNQNIHAADIPYECDANVIVLAGTRYALLRREFRIGSRERADRRPGTRVLAMFGASDPAGLSAVVLQAMYRLPDDVSLDLVVGPGGTRVAALEAAAESLGHRVCLHRNPTRLAALMARADLAIVAAGSAAWELAALGVPMVVTSVASNQEPVARELHRRGAAIDAGPAQGLTPVALADVIRTLAADADHRAGLATRAGQLVDRCGTDRVIAVCRVLASTGPFDWSIRSVAQDDVWHVWRVANDPSVRANSFNAQPIPESTHVGWFSSQLVQPGVRWWAADVGGVPIGHVRYSRASDAAAEVHFSVAAPFRGRGVAAGLLSRTFPLACTQLGIHSAFGVTLPANAASARAFLRAGYARVGNSDRGGRLCEIFERRVS